ncbi:MAG: methyltransferase domain-containing protein [Cyanobacteria bacterium P01_C01_bin.89]
MTSTCLRPEQRTKLDVTADRLFYDQPRFVTHVDTGFLDRLTRLYQERLPANGRILDLMSSWVSHLPDDVSYASVEGHGMNEAELKRNPRLDHFFVQDLNQNPELPLDNNSFDAVINTVSVQYLQYPEAIFSEIHRVLKPGGVAIVSFSNRMFFQKAIQAWRDGDEDGRVKLVSSYFASVEKEGKLGFSTPEAIAENSSAPAIFQLFGLATADPFYAVIAQKQG